MEFRPKDIAKLVLGYLKQEKCQAAFEEFLNSSVYLKDCAARYQKGRYIVTRIAGLNLVDYLTEYAAVYTIVQGRLEASEFYDERRPRTTLVQQLLYLLDNDITTESRASTPIHNGCRCSKNNSKHVTIGHNNSIDTISLDVDTTPLGCLPGNTNIFPTLNVSKNNSLTKANKSTNTDDELSSDRCDISEEVFTQTFLENVELHQKLAKNINMALSSSSEDRNNCAVAQQEMDVAIKTIVQRTEQDPIFDRLLEEIFLEPQREDRSNKNASDVENNFEIGQTCKYVEASTPKKCQSIEYISQRLLDSKRPSSSMIGTIDEQNNEAVQSIITASLSNEKQPSHKESNMVVSNNSTSYDAIVNQIVTNTTQQNVLMAVPNSQNQICMNTGGLLMLQSSASQSTNIVPTKSLQLDTTKSYCVINNQPYVNAAVQTSAVNIDNLYTEQDILTMPTIIVCDTNSVSNTQPVFIPSAVTTNKTYVSIAPKISKDKIRTAGDYLASYKCNDPVERSLPSSVNNSPEKSVPVKDKKKKLTKKKKSTAHKSNVVHQKVMNKSQPEESKNLSEPNVASTSNVHTAENLHIKIVELDSSAENAIDQNSEANKQNNLKTVSVSSLPSVLTPKVKISEVQEDRSRSTPRNGSHIRQLDFSTPEKVFPLASKANTSSKVEGSWDAKKDITPNRTNKESAKHVKSNLFSTSERDEHADDEKQKRNSHDSKLDKPPDASTSRTPKSAKQTDLDWDADLRALAGGTSDTPSPTQKRKRVSSPKESVACKRRKDTPSSHTRNKDKCTVEKNVEDTKNSNKKKSNKRSNKSRSKANLKKNINKSNNEEDSEEQSFSTSNVSNSVTEKATVVTEDVNRLKSECGQDCVDKAPAFINRNGKARIKRKCNMDNPIKKFTSSEEVVLTSITKIKSCEIFEENNSKMVLSPSKLNANKRTLIESSNNEMSNSIKHNDETKKEDSTILAKEISPESLKSLKTSSTADHNMTPFFETPVKPDLIAVPKTPGIHTSPVIDNTPFTKAVIDQLSGVDINAIPTPKFPITPNLSFTPALLNTQSPFSNRGTDYSTSSSYYQPSDTEQSKSIEQLLEEYREAENSATSKLKLTPQTAKVDQIPEEVDEDSTVLKNNPKSTVITEEITEINSETVKPNNNSLTEKMNAFNHSLVGKKNLHLMRMISTDSENSNSSESSSSTSESSSDSDDDSDSSYNSFDETIKPVVMEEFISDRYSFRPRKNLSTAGGTIEPSKEPKKCIEKPQTTNDNAKPEITCSKPQTFQDGLLQEMEAKRQRMIAKFKNADANSSVKDLVKKNTATKKSINDKPKASAANATGNAKKSPRNARTTSKQKNTPIAKKKLLPKRVQLKQQKSTPAKKKTRQNSPLLKNVAITEAKTIIDSDEQVTLHLSSDDENLEPFEMVETELLEHPTTSVPSPKNIKETIKKHTVDLDAESLSTLRSSFLDTASDQQNDYDMTDQAAETLVKGLKQWGIHLIPNKKRIGVKVEKPDISINKITPLDKKDQLKEKSTEKSQKDCAANIENYEKEKINLDNKLNVSLEEGEILSDTEISKTIEEDKRNCSANTKTLQNPKELSKSTNKKTSTTKDSRSRHSDNSKKRNVKESKKTPTSSNKSNTSNNIEPCKIETPSNNTEMKRDDEEMSSSVFSYDESFHIKTLYGETVHITHDYSKRINRTIKDYNFEILTKTISANVYISEIDAEVKKLMSITPFKMLLDIPSKINIKTTSQKETSKSKCNTLTSNRKAKRPLQILYNQIVKPADDIRNSSPLDNLYDTESSSNTKRMRDIESQRKSCNYNKKSKRVDDIIECSSAVGCSNNLVKEEQPISNLEVVDGVVMLNPVCDDQQDDDANDELMNYALVGSVRIANPESDQAESPEKSSILDDRKDKLSETNDDNIKQEQKSKTEGCQELLRNIDVESFLKKLHGDT